MLVDNEAISNLLGLFPKAASGGMTTILWVLLVVVVVGLVSLCLFVFFCLRRSKGYDVELPTRKPRKRRAIDEPLIDTSPDQFASTSRRSIIKVTDDPTELADDGGDIKARMFLRSSNRFVVKSYLSNIGTRQGKSFTLVLDKELKSSDPLLMAQVTLGDLCPISFQQPSNMVTFTAMLTKIQHPYVMPVHHVEYVPDRSVVLVFRRFIKEGSLRDYIHKKNPKDSWDRKYAASSTSLPYTTIQRFGRQILEGVRFFRLKDWTLPHLHTANVLVQNGVCRITDYENGVLCVVPRWRTKLAPLLGTVDPEVVAFGHVLWEMAVGSEYNGTSDVPTAVPSHVATTVAEILSRIFMIGHASAMSFDELVDHPFFAVAGVDIPDQKLVKFDSVMKSMIKSASQVMLSTIPLVTESTPSSSLALQVVADDETDDGKSPLLEYGRKGKSKSTKLKRTPKTQTTPTTPTTPSTASSSTATTPTRSATKSVSSSLAPSPSAPSLTSAPPPPPPMPSNASTAPPPSRPVSESVSTERSALLSSISSFSKNGLRKASTADKTVMDNLVGRVV